MRYFPMAKFNPSKAVNVIEKNCENPYLKQRAGSGPKNPVKLKCTIPPINSSQLN